VIAQRTATVSKSVLTQCNTVISLNSFDETSLGFLANFYGEAFKGLIPNLPRLHAVVFGKAVRSERPVVVEIPYVAEKDSSKHALAGAYDASRCRADGEGEIVVGSLAIVLDFSNELCLGPREQAPLHHAGEGLSAPLKHVRELFGDALDAQRLR
jgi:hypothetical protein